MITLNDVLQGHEFWHMTEKNADGTPVRCRKTGAVKTWVNNPDHFCVPVKHGMRDSFYISNIPHDSPNSRRNRGYFNCADWCTPEKWPAEHVLFEGIDAAAPQNVREKQLAQAREAFKHFHALAAVIVQLEKGHA